MADQIKKDRVVWIDLLRVVATFGIPLTHLCSNCWNITEGIHSTDWITLNFFSALGRWPVTAFVMISGIFFLNPSKPCDPKKIFTKNIVRMASSFAFWSLLYALQWTLFRPHAYGTTIPAFSKKVFLKELIIGEYHMWYLYMIAALYLVTPLIRVFTDNATKKQLEAFMALSFLFANFIPMLMRIPIFTQFGLNSVYGYISVSFVSGYAGVYVGGQYMMQYPFEKKQRRLVYILGVVGYLISTFGNIALAHATDKVTKELLVASLAPSVMIAYAMFTLFQHKVSKINFKDRTVKIIKWLSKHSFGVYLCHVFAMRAFQYFGIQVIHFSPEQATVDLSFLPYVHIPPVIGVPVLSVLVIILSYFISYLFSKIPFINKYIV